MLPTNFTETSNIPMTQASPATEAQPYQHPASFFANTKPIFPMNPKRKSHAQELAPPQRKPTLTAPENHSASPPQILNEVAAPDLNQQEILSLPYPELESSTTFDFEPEVPTFDFSGHNNSSSFPADFLPGFLDTKSFLEPTPPSLTLYEVIKAPEPSPSPYFHHLEPQPRPWNLCAFQEIIQAWDWTNTTRYQTPEVLRFAGSRLYDTTPESWAGIENIRANIITAAVMLRMAKITWKCGYRGFDVNEKGGYKVYDVKMGKVWPLPRWMPQQHIEILEGKSWDFMSAKQKVVVDVMREKQPIRSVEAVCRDWRGEMEETG